jgi:hypothetical protein
MPQTARKGNRTVLDSPRCLPWSKRAQPEGWPLETGHESSRLQEDPHTYLTESWTVPHDAVVVRATSGYLTLYESASERGNGCKRCFESMVARWLEWFLPGASADQRRNGVISAGVLESTHHNNHEKGEPMRTYEGSRSFTIGRQAETWRTDGQRGCVLVGVFDHRALHVRTSKGRSGYGKVNDAWSSDW